MNPFKIGSSLNQIAQSMQDQAKSAAEAVEKTAGQALNNVQDQFESSPNPFATISEIAGNIVETGQEVAEIGRQANMEINMIFPKAVQEVALKSGITQARVINANVQGVLKAGSELIQSGPDPAGGIAKAGNTLGQANQDASRELTMAHLEIQRTLTQAGLDIAQVAGKAASKIGSRVSEEVSDATEQIANEEAKIRKHIVEAGENFGESVGKSVAEAARTAAEGISNAVEAGSKAAESLGQIAADAPLIAGKTPSVEDTFEALMYYSGEMMKEDAEKLTEQMKKMIEAKNEIIYQIIDKL